ncbi:histone acetyltransferase type B catalytic subunit [Schistocerca nitens]|uniref:histone acetyltransferase type B catalytic subunit n=1 Tax=Schistocerca nitens TaxID=7011 RepID=UPI0021188590|nr:histone acetyltransferase type B catalytic subunit [Schistocerca nitens]
MNSFEKPLNPFVCSSNDALELKLVRSPEDLEDDDASMKPDMTHQVFGDNESIFGYRDLKVKLYYTASKLTTYLGMTYKEKIDPGRSDGICADDVLEKMSKTIPPGYYTNIDDFCREITKDYDFVPLGTLKKSFPINKEITERVFEVYVCDVLVPGYQDYHERLQTFLLWYIDAASLIDTDDDHWRMFVVYEKYKIDGSARYAVAGFATVYEFYAYPNNIRPRIGQMLILPPFQRHGLGSHLLECIYEYYVPMQEVVDITVEGPSDEFQRLRDFVDVRNCVKLINSQPDALKEGYQKFCSVISPLKLSKKQMRRVYEILKLHFTNIKNPDEYKQYRLEVKRRLNIPYQKGQDEYKKIQKFFNDTENNDENSSIVPLTDEQRMENLDREYQELENQYRQILQRLSLL